MNNNNYFSISLALAVGLFSNLAWSDIDTIDVVAVYPPSMAGSDPVARIANMEQYANKALENSYADIRFRVVHIEELDIANAKTDANTLYYLHKSPKAQSLRSQYGADLVTMITPTGPYCGTGFITRGNDGKINPNYSKYGYSVVGHLCTSSFAHELGHNLTLGHSHKQGSNGGLYSWGRGHGVDNTFATIMAYNSTYNAPRLQIFSTPNLDICKELPCGSPESAEDGANAVKAMAVAGPQIAAWYDSKIPTVSPNAKPIANDDMDTTKQGEAIWINVLANDTDSDQDTLIIESAGLAKHGSVTIDSDVIQYIPDSNFIGQDYFEYTISDGHDHTTTAMVRVNVGLGVNYKYYETSWDDEIIELSDLKSKAEGVAHNFTLTKRDRDFDYAFLFSGQIEIQEEGQYNFFVKSDDVSRLLIDGHIVVDNESYFRATEESGSIYLTAGLHSIVVEYYQLEDEQVLSIDWQGPNRERQMLTSNFLRLSTPK